MISTTADLDLSNSPEALRERELAFQLEGMRYLFEQVKRQEEAADAA